MKTTGLQDDVNSDTSQYRIAYFALLTRRPQSPAVLCVHSGFTDPMSLIPCELPWVHSFGTLCPLSPSPALVPHSAQNTSKNTDDGRRPNFRAGPWEVVHDMGPSDTGQSPAGLGPVSPDQI